MLRLRTLYVARARARSMSTRLPIFQVDAFAQKAFEGNPAAVVPMDAWMPDETLQAIAAENNLSETAFIVACEGEDEHDYRLRWFTPTIEVDLCGHATLAAAFVVLGQIRPELERVRFTTRSGTLTVQLAASRLKMDFPAWPVTAPAHAPPALLEALGGRGPPVACSSIPEMHGGPYFLLEYASALEVAALSPDFGKMDANVIATAPADEHDDVDFVSRFFGPCAGIDEDPVTGSAHCTLAPYWAARLGKPTMDARQVSARGGHLRVTVDGERVSISGSCALVLKGTLML